VEEEVIFRIGSGAGMVTTISIALESLLNRPGELVSWELDSVDDFPIGVCQTLDAGCRHIFPRVVIVGGMFWLIDFVCSRHSLHVMLSI
jgi:hypothetical protein